MPDPRIFPVDFERIDSVNIGNISLLVVPANVQRVGLDLTNLTTGAELISLAFGQAAILGEGKCLTAYGSTFHMGTSNLYHGDIYAISDGQKVAMAVSEELRRT